MLEIVSGWINLLCNISKSEALHILKWGLGSRDAGSFKILIIISVRLWNFKDGGS